MIKVIMKQHGMTVVIHFTTMSSSISSSPTYTSKMLHLTAIFTIFFSTINDVDSVIAGVKVCLGNYPYVAAIWKGEKHVCGGSILDETHILTAAHCIASVQETDCTVTVGAVDIRSPSKIRVNVLKFHIHPDYKRITDMDIQDKRNSVHDIAILKLATELEWSDYVKPISLRRQPGMPTCDCYIAGWGPIEKRRFEMLPELRWGQLYIMDSASCLRYKPGPNEICAVNPVVPDSAAPGDSGGPFICSGQLTGVIVSCTLLNRGPTIILRTSPYLSPVKLDSRAPYLPFIDQILSLSPPPRPTPTPNVFEFLKEQGALCST